MTCSKQQPTDRKYATETTLVMHVLLTSSKSVFGEQTTLKMNNENNDLFKVNILCTGITKTR